MDKEGRDKDKEEKNMEFEYVYGENVEREYADVKMSIERITPQVAAEMLERNTHNRKMPREPIAEAIMGGEWELNGATIVFSDEGVLLDGQTRLTAIAESGEPCDTIVVRGISASAQMVMDTGVKRSVTAQLELLGVKDAANIGTAAGRMYRKDHWGIESAVSGLHTEMTIKAIVAYALENEERLRHLSSLCRPIYRRFKVVTLGNIVAIVDEFEKIDADVCYDFLDQLAARKDQCQPVQKLTAKLDENGRKQVGRYPSRIVGALVIKTWNAYLCESELTSETLRFRTVGPAAEPFPEAMSF